MNVSPQHLDCTGRMSDVIVRAENLGKTYRIRHQRPERYTALRDVIAERAGRLLRARRNNASESPAVEDFWALKNVSFEIRRGEVLGIIGRNGAGKSTLLKLLSRITEPTAGRIELYGRVASLLEVGTGFHPELSGRENIYLNGAILGMTRVEIQRKFDEIVAFADVEKFLDTPVKRYSSGMYVRLAFAVAAHLEPEILIVDEVLAVGDAEFQKKCLGKMRDASRGGRTVFFVSHNLAAIQSLCDRAMLLDRGEVVRIGSANETVESYLSGSGASQQSSTAEKLALGPSLTLARFEIDPNSPVSGDGVVIHVRIVPRGLSRIRELALLLYTSYGERVAVFDLRAHGICSQRLHGQAVDFDIGLDNLPLVDGEYTLGMYVVTDDNHGDYLNLASFTVRPKPIKGGIIPYSSHDRGFLEIDFTVKQHANQPA